MIETISADPEFEIGKWQVALVKDPEDYRLLVALGRHAPALRTYMGSEMTTVECAGGQPRIVPWAESAVGGHFEEFAAGSIEAALDRYGRQMVVLARTYLEAIVREFLIALFTAHPERMHGFLGGKSKTDGGHVTLAEVVSAPDRETLIRVLATRAASWAGRGSFPDVVRRLAKLTREAVPADLAARLNDLTNLRNRIVHDGAKPWVGDSDVARRFDDVLEFLRHLGRVAHNLGLRYSDPGDLLGLLPRPEYAGDEWNG